MTLSRTRGEGCASSLVIDRRLAGELSGAEIAELGRHLSTCPRCQTKMNEMRRSFAAFSLELPRCIVERLESPSRGTAPSPTNAWRRWAPAVAGGLGLAAAFAVWVRATAESRQPIDRSFERSKGAARVTMYVQHAGSVRRASDGERVLPGDAIEFAYSTDRSGYLAVLSVDGARHVSVYFAQGGRAARIAPAQEAPVDQSTVLDSTLGDESLYALFCDHPLDVGPIVSALEAQPERAPSVAGCVVDRHTLVKAPR